MTSDQRALLAAIVADPADDTLRLVYADCLDEHGNAARAEFIRVQVEAERHHPDSNTRGALEDRAGVLFEQNWREWWCEVCEAVGLPMSEFERYGATEQCGVARADGLLMDWVPVAFRRGFPESVALPALLSDTLGDVLARWAAVSPLTELVAVSAFDEQLFVWPGGPHLRTVRQLSLSDYDPRALSAALGSPHLGAVDHLTFDPPIGVVSDADLLSDDVAALLASPLARRLKHLRLTVGTDRVVELLIGTESLARLESLRLPVHWPRQYPNPLPPVATFDALPRAPHFGALRKLVLTNADLNEAMAVLQSPAWSRLTHLELDFGRGQDQLRVFRERDELTNLEELRVSRTVLTAEAVRDLARSPLLKRLKHFSLGGIYNDGRALLPLVDAVDPKRIETFALAVPHFPRRAADALRAKFGDRVRFLPT